LGSATGFGDIWVAFVQLFFEALPAVLDRVEISFVGPPFCDLHGVFFEPLHGIRVSVYFSVILLKDGVPDGVMDLLVGVE
jgi:hypothetical protein